MYWVSIWSGLAILAGEEIAHVDFNRSCPLKQVGIIPQERGYLVLSDCP